MKRSSSPQVTERNVPILTRLQALKAAHLFWGYRRCLVLRYVEGLAVNKKRILHVMRAQGLLVPLNRQHKALSHADDE